MDVCIFCVHCKSKGKETLVKLKADFYNSLFNLKQLKHYLKVSSLQLGIFFS